MGHAARAAIEEHRTVLGSDVQSVEPEDLYKVRGPVGRSVHYNLAVVLGYGVVLVEGRCIHFDAGTEVDGIHLDHLASHLYRREGDLHRVSAEIVVAARSRTVVADYLEEDQEGVEEEESYIAACRPFGSS